jgi:trigger factor
LSLTFPADFSQAERAGKPIEFVVTVKQILEADLPSLDEAFVKKLGVKSGQMSDLVEQVKQSLNFERDRLIKEKLKEQVFTQLLEQNTIEVPHSLIEQEAKQIHDEIYPQHQPHDHADHSEQETQAFTEIAKKRVALGLLIAEYGRQKQLQTDQNRVKQRIQEIASVYENPQEVTAYLSTPERLRGIESQVMEDQVMDKLMEGVAITDKTMSYAELKGIRS